MNSLSSLDGNSFLLLEPRRCLLVNQHWFVSKNFFLISRPLYKMIKDPIQLLLLWIMCMSAQSCLTLCDPKDCGPPGSSVHGILRARILEWVAISFSRGSSRPRDQTRVSCIAGGFFTTEPLGKPHNQLYSNIK